MAEGKQLLVHGETGHRLNRVLRARPGDRFTLVDPGKEVFSCIVIDSVSSDRITLEIADRSAVTSDPSRPKVILCQSLLSRFLEDALRLGAESGASQMWVLKTRRCAPGAERGFKRGRIEAMATHAMEVARDPGHCAVDGPITVEQMVERCSSMNILPLALVPDGDCGLIDVQPRLVEGKFSGYALVIGPEGGLTPGEIETVALSGGMKLSLGSRILPGASAGGLALFALSALARYQNTFSP
jgi:16S rRNA (uracil1498-N3)-methyltransferase